MGLMSALSAASAGLEIAGSIKSLFGGKKRGPAPEDIAAMQTANTYRHFRDTIGAAKENGIHPLYALGIQPAPGMEMSLGSNDRDIGQAMSDAGQNIGAALHRLGTKQERDLSAITARQAVERGDLENELLKSQIAQIRASINPPLSVTNKGQLISGQEVTMPGLAGPGINKVLGNVLGNVGLADGISPLLRVGTDQKGNPLRVYNDDLGDNEVLQALTALGFTIPDYIHGNFTKRAGSWLRKKLSPRISYPTRKKGG